MVAVDIAAHEARVNVTWNGRNGDLVDAVPYNANDGDIRAWVCEALRSGAVAGMRADRVVNLQDYVVDRFPASRQVPYNRIFVRPKTPFG